MGDYIIRPPYGPDDKPLTLFGVPIIKLAQDGWGVKIAVDPKICGGCGYYFSGEEYAAYCIYCGRKL